VKCCEHKEKATFFLSALTWCVSGDFFGHGNGFYFFFADVNGFCLSLTIVSVSDGILEIRSRVIYASVVENVCQMNEEDVSFSVDFLA